MSRIIVKHVHNHGKMKTQFFTNARFQNFQIWKTPFILHTPWNKETLWNQQKLNNLVNETQNKHKRKECKLWWRWKTCNCSFHTIHTLIPNFPCNIWYLVLCHLVIATRVDMISLQIKMEMLNKGSKILCRSNNDVVKNTIQQRMLLIECI